jgi:hypothetical protein
MSGRATHQELTETLVGLRRFIRHPDLVGDPVGVPGLASIIGERLFKVRHARGRVGPDKPNENAFSIQHVLGVKLASSVLELADLRYDHLAVLAVGPIQTPLVRRRIVSAQGQAFDVAGCAITLELIQIRPPISNFEAVTRALEIHSFRGTG